MSLISGVDNAVFLPIPVVGISFLIAWISLQLSKLSDRSVITKYNSYVGKSRYEPPTWVFSTVWAVIYISYAVLWTAVNVMSINHDSRMEANILLGVGMILNVAWSLFIIFGSIDSKLSAKYAFWMSTITLGVIAMFNFLVLWRFWNIFRENRVLQLGSTGVFSIYGIWAVIATFVSLTSPRGTIN